jgi:trk system potassium uptake protein TrkH
VVLVLIQRGGVGLMAFAVLSLLVAGGRPALRFQLFLGEALGRARLADVARVARATFAVAFVAESAGAAILALRFAGEGPWEGALWSGIFHAVSAFNNAGFSLHADSLTRYADDVLVNLTIITLFVLGGLGFLVLADRGLFRGRPALHTRLMLWGTLVLSGLATAAFWWFEQDNPATLGGLGVLEQGLRALFAATTPRTAGFNTVDVGALETPSLILTIWLMFIGGGAGSTAGGVKLTTVLVLLAATRAFLAGRTEPVLLDRRLGTDVVLRSLAIAFIGLLGMAITFMMLAVAEPTLSFRDLVFEVVSAFGTVGLSTGITGELSASSRLVLCTAMFVGRLGPLTLAFMLATASSARIRPPKGEVYVG